MKRHLFPLAAAVSAAALALTPTTTTQEPARLLRYPHVQGDTVVFTKGGDLWTASMQDGIARRLTSFDEGLEVFGRISPDGKQVAFSGEYGGTRQVFVVPIDPEQSYFPKITSRVTASGSMESAPLHRMSPDLPEALAKRVLRHLPLEQKELTR